MPATLALVAANVAIWLVAVVIQGAPVFGSHPAPGIQTELARNAIAMAGGEWWRGITAGFDNVGLIALVYVMAGLVLAGMQVERTMGTGRFLAIYGASLLAGAFVALLVEPATALNAGSSGATLGVVAAAVVAMHRKGVPLHRTFWVPIIVIMLILGFLFPATVTWGAHVGGIIAGTFLGIAFTTQPARRQLWLVLGSAVHGPARTAADRNGTAADCRQASCPN